MNNLLTIGKKIRALAQTGINFSHNEYDLDRYNELLDISHTILSMNTGIKKNKVPAFFEHEQGYPTPKIDIRAAIFDQDNILLVKEKADNLWSVPGGWADIGYSPAEVAVKEVKEEAGLEVKANRLLAVVDKRNYKHPKSIYYAYKMFFECEIVGGVMRSGTETADVQFFNKNDLPQLSLNRITEDQIKMLFEQKENKNNMTIFE